MFVQCVCERDHQLRGVLRSVYNLLLRACVWDGMTLFGLIAGAAVGCAAIPAVLAGAGFTTAGVAAGSVAAAAQSALGGTVAAGSLFATAQSVGMAGVSATTAAVSSVAGAIASQNL